MAFQLPADMQVRLSVQAFDAAGHSVHDTFTWSLDDSTVARLIDAADQAVTLVAGAPGRVVVSAIDPSGLGAAFEVEVVPGTPVSAVISAGTPEPKTEREGGVGEEAGVAHVAEIAQEQAVPGY